tara:strand:- start:134845 stop:135045 length:201 start_codon:yes stop_codon:yes gene_type:complete
MSNDFEFLKGYTSVSDAPKRERAIRAALILLNTAVAADPSFTHNLSNDGFISDIADKIQESLKVDE